MTGGWKEKLEELQSSGLGMLSDSFERTKPGCVVKNDQVTGSKGLLSGNS